MPSTVNVSISGIMTEVRSVIVDVLPSQVQVIRGQIDRTPMPKTMDSPNGFVVINPINLIRLSINTQEFVNTDQPNNIGNVALNRQAQRVALQIDVYGQQAYEWATILTTVFRSDYGCSRMSLGQPLHADDPLQSPLIDSEMQWEDKWAITAYFQYNPKVSTPMDYPTELGPVHIYPPGDERT